MRRRKPDSRNSETQAWGSWNSPLRPKSQSRARVTPYTRESCEMQGMVEARSRFGAAGTTHIKLDLLKLKANSGNRAILLTPPPSTYGVFGCLRRQRAFDKEPAAAALLAVPSGKIVCRVRLKSVD